MVCSDGSMEERLLRADRTLSEEEWEYSAREMA